MLTMRWGQGQGLNWKRGWSWGSCMKNSNMGHGVVVQDLNPSTPEGQAGGSL